VDRLSIEELKPETIATPESQNYEISRKRAQNNVFEGTPTAFVVSNFDPSSLKRETGGFLNKDGNPVYSLVDRKLGFIVAYTTDEEFINRLSSPDKQSEITYN